MKTIRRLIYVEVLKAVSFVALGFLCLFFFFDLVDELQNIAKPGSSGYGMVQALIYVALLVPGHLYELLPIAVLIGTVFVMARLAETSEYTILRTSGLGPWRALRTLLVLGLGFVVLTFLVGDYVAPVSNQASLVLKARYRMFYAMAGTGTGAWIKERQGDKSYAVNVRTMDPDGNLKNPRIFEFDAKGSLSSQTTAQFARIENNGVWTLHDAKRQEYLQGDPVHPRVVNDTQSVMQWPSSLSREMISVALLDPERMSTIDLFEYIRHLDANGQTTRRYEIEFWRKVFYPLSCLVMIVLALPFAYLHFRQGGITGYVFGGVMIGISFFLLNNVFGYIGNLGNWVPWISAAAPGLIYSVVSLAAFGWLVLRR